MLTHLFGCQIAQPALPGFAALVYPKPSRSSLGWMGEVTVQHQLQAAGYEVCPGRRGEGDLHAIDRRSGETFRIEVKTAMQSIDRKWRFLLWKPGRTNYRCSDVVILLAVLADFSYVPFAIRVDDLGQRSQLCITSHPASYRGWLSPYRLAADADLLSFSPSLHSERGLGGEVLEAPLSETV